jgi:hypothetical protein
MVSPSLKIFCAIKLKYFFEKIGELLNENSVKYQVRVMLTAPTLFYSRGDFD